MIKTNVLLGIALVVAAPLASCVGTASALYPLKEGQTWEYQVAETSIPNGRGLKVTVSNMAERDLNGKRVIPQKAEVGGQTEFAFVASDSTGIYEYARQETGALEPEIRESPQYYLKYPLVQGASWSGSLESYSVTPKVLFSTQTTIDSVNETVTVPAGTFNQCVKTKTTGATTKKVALFGFAPGIVTLEQYSWYCRGFGAVKTVRTEANSAGGPRRLMIQLESYKK